MGFFSWIFGWLVPQTPAGVLNQDTVLKNSIAQSDETEDRYRGKEMKDVMNKAIEIGMQGHATKLEKHLREMTGKQTDHIFDVERNIETGVIAPEKGLDAIEDMTDKVKKELEKIEYLSKRRKKIARKEKRIARRRKKRTTRRRKTGKKTQKKRRRVIQHE
jgi:hypothetical protein